MKQKKTDPVAQEPAIDTPQETPEVQAEVEETAVDWQSQCIQAEAQRDEYLAMAQRVQADFDNYRRRNQSARAEAFEDGAAAFIKTILPVCDNLERALAAQTNDATLTDGVSLVLRQLNEALEKRGVTAINRIGEPFDPTLEDAVAQAAAEEGEPGTVAEVLLKGYKMGDNVLRHAMVRVVP
ncbi:MAG: nucleotide exchange factor GrpE [Christensenellales bacterium]|jgi:molecular chaperone GrpE